MMAQAQLDDTRTCAENLIGTGPFKLVNWTPNQSLTAEKNPDYWATDAEGNQLPYLDEIEFRPIVEVAQRLNALQSGEINAMHTSDADTIDQIRGLADSGDVTAVESDQFGEVSYIMLNESKPPFDNIKARQALAHARTSTRSTRSSTPGSPPRPPDRSRPATSAISTTPASPPMTRIAPRSWSRSTNPRPANRCRSRTRPPRPRRPSHRPSSSRSRPKRLA